MPSQVDQSEERSAESTLDGENSGHSKADWMALVNQQKQEAAARAARIANYKFTKQCSARAAIDWVAEQIENAEAEPADAPGATAWNLLMAVQGSEAAKKDFWAKFMARASKESASGEEPDQKRHVELVKLIDEVAQAGEQSIIAAHQEEWGDAA